MKKEIEPFISLVIPEAVLGDNRLTFLERVLLIEIVSLCKKNGYCWPTNRYFMDKFDCTKPTISKSISSLSKYNYIDIEINNCEKNNSKSIQNNFNHYNKYKNNKKDILNDIYSVDDEGNEYWHGVKIESEKMTDEEVKELEDLLKNFK